MKIKQLLPSIIFTVSLITTNAASFPLETKKVISMDSIPADPNDILSIDGIMGALYSSISGPVATTRNWNRLRTLYIPEAKLIAVTRRRPDSTMGKRVISLEDYIKIVGPQMEKDGFYEQEIGRTTQLFGNMAHVFSAYETKHTETDLKSFSRGINSLQLFNDGKRWWILSVYWQSESAEIPIPAEYLGWH